MRTSRKIMQAAFCCLILSATAQAQFFSPMESEIVGDGLPIRVFPEWHSTDFRHACTPTFSFTVDVPVLTRTHADSQPFLTGTGGVVLLDMGDIGLTTEGAIKLDLILYDESGWDLEFAYMGTEDFSARGRYEDRNLAFTFYNGNPANPARWYFIDYESNLHGAEFNLRRRVGPHLTFLAGVRGLQLHEAFDILRGTDINTGFYSKTYNHLWGGQIGGDVRYWFNGVVGLTASAKAGAYSNSIKVHATAASAGTGAALDMIHTTSDAAFFGEATVGMIISMGHYAAIRLGYMIMAADGVALAPDQNDRFDIFTSSGSVSKGTPVYQGGYAGFEFTY